MDFIGLQMLVTVKDPPGVRVKGTVSEVTPGQSLVLSNVFHLGSSKWIPRLTLEPNNIVDLAEYKDEVTPETFTAPDAPLQAPKKRNRRARPNKALKNGTAEDASLEASLPQGGRGKGWRQTPMLQSTSSFQPFKALKRNGKAGNGVLDNGWASEDVTEEMGEFDFEGELAKFDKQTIFNQMQKDDLVEESDRLVSHNRKAKPGTAGGKNYHHTENVLDIPAATPKMANDFWDSETDDAALGPERLSGRDVRSSQSMRRTDSNRPNAGKRSQSRKASASGIPPTSRANLASQPGFYLVPSQRRAEPVSALQMLNLENIAANEIGLTEDMMTENAGRGIAAISHTSSIIVVLAGNNKSGIRAVAAARHLGNKGVSVLVCVVGIERERDLLEDMRQQVRIFKNLGGRIHNKIELFEQLRKTSHSSSATVTLIIDALLGLAISFEELRTGDQATVYELIEWANRNEAFTLAVDVPTGIDPSTGKVSIIDGGRLYVKPRYVVAMGAPKRGLLEAMAPPLRPSEEGNPKSLSAPAADNDDWKLFIIDIGLGAAVWKKAGTKLRRGIDFDDKWVLEMRYQGATGQGEEPDY
ncbi:Enhancer of mRNA-decapping protein 3 like [Verticillium longisporum]|uniref:Enhancer of mRNA-decapping protein 3 n=1 Tax=Verticillium longisporum TaxID=100787 RepID=A0A8I2ZPF6_VERLO|nr:Enhancer of mRNA-decapping protein 3 like [Verticillium longisporum]